MKRILKSIVSISLCIVMLLTVFPMADITFFASAEVVGSGKCGNNLTWTLDSDGKLTIEGTGEMYDNSYFQSWWSDYTSEILGVVIADGVTSIGNSAFYDCNSLTSITIPDGVTSIGEKAFYSCDSLTCITVDDNNPNYSSDEFGVLFNKNKTELIQFPAGSSETSYNIPDSVTSIGNSAFRDCDSLTSITIPDSVTSIGYSAFSSCDSLTSIIIPDSVTSIGDSAFYYCTGLTSITLPQSAEYIGGQAFYQCSELKSIKLPEGITEIGQYLFYYCTSLTDILIPDSVSEIHKSAFEGCKSLKSLIIPEGVTELPNFWLRDCISLAEIKIPDSVTLFISASYFSDTAYYKNEDNWENGLLYIGNHLIDSKIDVSACSVKEGTITIADYAFAYNKLLAGITIPDSVVYIGSNAFYNCTELKEVTIPEKVQRVDSYAFNGPSSALKSITFLNPDTIIIDGAVSNEAVIYGYENSTAQEYAEMYDREFVLIQKHTHSYKSKVTTQPTCAKEGVKTFTCVCGSSYTEAIAKLAAHTWGEWKVTKAATYEAEGREERSCSVCKKTEGRVIPKLEYKEIEIPTTEEVKPLGEDAVLVLSDASVGEIIKNTKGNVSVTDKDGKAVSEKDSVASGMTVTLKDASGKVIDEKTIVVPGDNNGDGKITAADARSALRASVSLDKLNTWQTSASNVDKTAENKITAADARFILRASVGLEKFSEWMKAVK